MRLKKVLSAIMGSLLLTLGVVTISNNSAKDVNAENLSVTYTIDSTTAVSTTGNAPANSSATYSQTYSNAKGQMTSNNSTTLVLAGYDGMKINSLTLSMKSNTSKGSGSLVVTAGNTQISSISDSAFNSSNWNGAWSTAYVDIIPTIEPYTVGNNEEIKIEIKASANSIYIQSYTLGYELSTPTTGVTFKTTTQLGFTTEYTGVVGNSEGVAELVTDSSELSIGDKVIITSNTYDYALGKTQNSNNRQGIAISSYDENDSTLQFHRDSDVQLLTLTNGNKEGTYGLYTGEGYLYAASSSSNYLRTENTLSDNSSWTLTIDSEKASLTANGTYTRNQLKYNSASNNIFSCYASGQQDICIFKVTVDVQDSFYEFTTFSNYSLRFGSEIKEENVSSILAEGETYETLNYGVLVTPTSQLSDYVSFEEMSKGFTLNDIVELTNAQNVTFTGEELVANEGNIGVILKNIPYTDREISAVVYAVATDGTVYFANQVTVSIKTVVAEYAKLTEGLDEAQMAAVKALNEELNTPEVEA